MTLVKICGITNLPDALAVIEAGADILGFNFYRPSPRYIQPLAARAIIDNLPKHVLTAGVFVNEETPSAVEDVAAEAGVTALQLHGDESPAFCAALSHRYVIKVLPIGPGFDAQVALEYDVPAFMVDVLDKKRRGGTGEIVDWSKARVLRDLVPQLFLAGGLSAANVADAISVVEPYAVDACSALETSPGKKDTEKVRQFVRTVANMNR